MSEYKLKEGMIDNRMVKENHQQGIHRVLQRGHDRLDYCGHDGKMGTIKPKDHFSRRGDSLTPRRG